VDGCYYNRLYFVKPNGDVTFYDKHHLFTYADEHRGYKRGDERVEVEYRGVRFLLQVCYDLRFPVFCRNRGDYDMMIFVAAWPTSRIHVWDTLLKARALENQCYVAGVNRIGTDPKCEYCGHSVIVSPYGDVMVRCEDDKECSAAAEIDIERLQSFRKKFPVLNDADAES
jgi:predicted amidohydrolase